MTTYKCGCGRTGCFQDLRLIGYQQAYPGILELRNCECESTLSQFVETFMVSTEGIDAQEHASIGDAMKDADRFHGFVSIRSDRTADGQIWGAGLGRAVADRINGKWTRR